MPRQHRRSRSRSRARPNQPTTVRTGRQIRREQIFWAPILTAATVALAAVITGWKGPDRWTLAAYTLTTLLLITGIWRRTDNTAERIYGITCVLTGLSWTVAAWTIRGHIADLFWSLLLATMVLGFFWWTNERQHTRVRIEAEQRAWPALAAGTRLARTLLTAKTRTPTGWTAVLRWAPGEFSVHQALDSAEDLESITDAPSESITIERIGRDSNKVRIRCVEHDPHATPIPWDGTVLTTISDAADLGLFPDGTALTTTWWQPGIGGHHKLLAGITRSGKSTLLRLLACLYGPAEDVVQWMIDLKGGMALHRIAPLADWFATEPNEALHMLAAAVRIIDARGRYATTRGWEVWQTSPTHPALIIHVDEMARLTGVPADTRIAMRATQLCTDILQLGAGVGVLFNAATQYAVLDALGSSQLREQFGWTACFRMRTEGLAHHFLPNAPAGIDPANIANDRKGTCYIDDLGKFRPQPARICNPTDTQIDTVVRDWWDRTPELDEVSRTAAGPDYTNRDTWTPDGATTPDTPQPETGTTTDETPVPVPNPTGTPPPPYTELTTADWDRLSPEQRRAELTARTRILADRADGNPDTARAVLIELLTTAGPDGIWPRDARKACRMSESWVFRELRRLREEGRAQVNPDGRTRLLDGGGSGGARVLVGLEGSS